MRRSVADKWESPEWRLASEVLEEKCDPYETEVSTERKDTQAHSFVHGCALGYNTFIAHFDSTFTVPPTPASKTSWQKLGKSGTVKPRPNKAASANACSAAAGIKRTPSSRKRQAGAKASNAAGESVTAETPDQHERTPGSAASKSSSEPSQAEVLDPQTQATVEDPFYSGSISSPAEMCDYQELALTGNLNSEMLANRAHPCSEPCRSLPNMPAEPCFLPPAPSATSAQEEPPAETQTASMEVGMYEPLSMAAWPYLKAAEAQRTSASWRSPKPVTAQAVPFTAPRQVSRSMVGSAAVALPPLFQTVQVPARSSSSIPGWAAIPRSAAMTSDEPSVPAEPQETDSRAGPVSFPSGSLSVSEVQPPFVPPTMGTGLGNHASTPPTDQLNTTPSMQPQTGVQTTCDLPSLPAPNQPPSTDIGEHQATATCSASQQAPSDTQPSPPSPLEIRSSRNVQCGLRVTEPSSTGRIPSGCSGSSPPMPEPSCSESTTSSAPVAASEGYKVTQCNAHFEHCSRPLFLYFVDAHYGGKKEGVSSLYRLIMRYFSVCRIALCKTSPTATTMYVHLLHPPLLCKVCAGTHSNCHREGNYLPQVNLSWDRVVESGEGPYMCGVDVLGKSRVLRTSLSGPRHWDCISNFILRTRNSTQVLYSAMREMHAVRDLKTVPRPSVRDHGVAYALLSAWSCSFQADDELAPDPTGYRKTPRFYSQDAQGRTSESTRSDIGDLSAIHAVPKFMARMGQAFSHTLGFVTVPRQYASVDRTSAPTR